MQGMELGIQRPQLVEAVRRLMMAFDYWGTTRRGCPNTLIVTNAFTRGHGAPTMAEV